MWLPNHSPTSNLPNRSTGDYRLDQRNEKFKSILEIYSRICQERHTLSWWDPICPASFIHHFDFGGACGKVCSSTDVENIRWIPFRDMAAQIESSASIPKSICQALSTLSSSGPGNKSSCLDLTLLFLTQPGIIDKDVSKIWGFLRSDSRKLSSEICKSEEIKTQRSFKRHPIPVTKPFPSDSSTAKPRFHLPEVYDFITQPLALFNNANNYCNFVTFPELVLFYFPDQCIIFLVTIPFLVTNLSDPNRSPQIWWL